jgi:hypothetical protein
MAGLRVSSEETISELGFLEQKFGSEPATPTLARWRFWSTRFTPIPPSGGLSTQFPLRLPIRPCSDLGCLTLPDTRSIPK